MANDNNLPVPESRSEELLNRIVQNTAGNGADTPLPDPQSREEQYLAKIAENTAGGGGGGGGGGGADVLWVHVTTEDDETWQADKTFAQIHAAAEAGTIVKAKVEWYENIHVCDLVYYNSNEFDFSAFQAQYSTPSDARSAYAVGVYIYAERTPSVVVKFSFFDMEADD